MSHVCDLKVGRVDSGHTHVSRARSHSSKIYTVAITIHTLGDIVYCETIRTYRQHDRLVAPASGSFSLQNVHSRCKHIGRTR